MVERWVGSEGMDIGLYDAGEAEGVMCISLPKKFVGEGGGECVTGSTIGDGGEVCFSSESASLTCIMHLHVLHTTRLMQVHGV